MSNNDIHFSGSVEWEDQIQAYKLIYGFGRLRLLRWATFLLILGAGVMAAVGLIQKPSSGLAIIIIVAVVFWVVRRLQKRRRAMLHKVVESQLRGLYGSLGEHSIQIHGPGVSSEAAWSNYIGYRANDRMILLFQNELTYNVLLRNMFATEEDWQQAGKLVQLQLPDLKTSKEPPAVSELAFEPPEEFKNSISFKSNMDMTDLNRIFDIFARRTRWRKLATWILLPAYFLYLASFLFQSRPLFGGLVMLVFAGGVWIQFLKHSIFKRSWRVALRTLDRQAGLIGESGVWISKRTGYLLYRWTYLDSYVITDDYLVLLVNPFQHFGIPRRAFQSDEAWADALEIVENNLPRRGSKQKIPSIAGICHECGKATSKDNMLSIDNKWICADCKENYVQKIKEGAV